jgi:hypothetical protein
MEHYSHVDVLHPLRLPQHDKIHTFRAPQVDSWEKAAANNSSTWIQDGDANYLFAYTFAYSAFCTTNIHVRVDLYFQVCARRIYLRRIGNGKHSKSNFAHSLRTAELETCTLNLQLMLCE